MGARDQIRLLRRGQTLVGAPPMMTLLDYLRLVEGSKGTKEGCAEGDCGACTVALGRLAGGRVVYEPVNACIHLVGQADGREVVTVEDLAQAGQLHPVQRAMADHHASQCGFCTPGFVMSLFALYHRANPAPLDRAAVNDALAGNLCRCTGYRPIVDAALAVCAGPAEDAFAARLAHTAQALASLDDGTDIFIGTAERFFAAPASIESLSTLYAAHPDATLVAGATDVGLWITKGLRDLPKVIALKRVAGLDEIVEAEDRIAFGATVAHAAAMHRLGAIDPDLRELWRRFGSEQVRAVGTLGGNIANGSPIGDAAPALIALGATLELQLGSETRTLPLEAYFLAYGRQDRRPGEWVRGVRVPKLGAGEVFRCYKATKRFDEDISAVMGAFRLRLDGCRISEARVAFGGMAATPKRAGRTETALVGLDLDRPDGWTPALDALAADFQPIGDHRASARYRVRVARAFLEKAMVEIAGLPSAATRVRGVREGRLAVVA